MTRHPLTSKPVKGEGTAEGLASLGRAWLGWPEALPARVRLGQGTRGGGCGARLRPRGVKRRARREQSLAAVLEGPAMQQPSRLSHSQAHTTGGCPSSTCWPREAPPPADLSAGSTEARVSASTTGSGTSAAFAYPPSSHRFFSRSGPGRTRSLEFPRQPHTRTLTLWHVAAGRLPPAPAARGGRPSGAAGPPPPPWPSVSALPCAPARPALWLRSLRKWGEEVSERSRE